MPSTPLLHYESHGDPLAPPVIFLHGFMGSTRDWDDVIECLSRTNYCVAVDLPGHGRSLDLADDAYTLPGAVRLVLRVMEHTQIIPGAVAGYSMGGRLALHLAIHHSDTCSKLIVESATAGIRGKDERVIRQHLDEKRAEELEQGRFEDFLQTWYGQPLFAALADDPEKLARVLRRRRFNEPTELARALRGMGVGTQVPLWDRLSGVAIPVLLVTGERDSKYVEILRAMAELLPCAALEVVSGVGHNVHVEDPAAVAKRIKGFF